MTQLHNKATYAEVASRCHPPPAEPPLTQPSKKTSGKGKGRQAPQAKRGAAPKVKATVSPTKSSSSKGFVTKFKPGGGTVEVEVDDDAASDVVDADDSVDDAGVGMDADDSMYHNRAPRNRVKPSAPSIIRTRASSAKSSAPAPVPVAESINSSVNTAVKRRRAKNTAVLSDGPSSGESDDDQPNAKRPRCATVDDSSAPPHMALEGDVNQDMDVVEDGASVDEPIADYEMSESAEVDEDGVNGSVDGSDDGEASAALHPSAPLEEDVDEYDLEDPFIDDAAEEGEDSMAEDDGAGALSEEPGEEVGGDEHFIEDVDDIPQEPHVAEPAPVVRPPADDEDEGEPVAPSPTPSRKVRRTAPSSKSVTQPHVKVPSPAVLAPSAIQPSIAKAPPARTRPPTRPSTSSHNDGAERPPPRGTQSRSVAVTTASPTPARVRSPSKAMTTPAQHEDQPSLDVAMPPSTPAASSTKPNPRKSKSASAPLVAPTPAVAPHKSSSKGKAPVPSEVHDDNAPASASPKSSAHYAPASTSKKKGTTAPLTSTPVPRGNRTSTPLTASTSKSAPAPAASRSVETSTVLGTDASLEATPSGASPAPAPSTESSTAPKVPPVAPKNPKRSFKSVIKRSTPATPRKGTFLGDAYFHKLRSLPDECQVTDTDLQDPALAELYKNLPPLPGIFKLWTNIRGDGYMLFSNWEEDCPELDYDSAIHAIDFKSHRHFINIARISPLDVLVRELAGPSPVLHLYTGDRKVAICLAPVQVKESHILAPSPTGIKQKRVNGVFHSQEFERMVGFVCAAFSKEELSSQVGREEMQFTTRSVFGDNESASSSKKYSPSKPSPATASSSSSARAPSKDPFTLGIDDEIPVYDCRDFTLNLPRDLDRLDSLPRWTQEIPTNSFAIIAHTITVYYSRTKFWSVSFNIHWVMLLGTPPA